jgi:hypothetical protein
VLYTRKEQHGRAARAIQLLLDILHDAIIKAFTVQQIVDKWPRALTAALLLKDSNFKEEEGVD